jgi:hypothetical protein
MYLPGQLLTDGTSVTCQLPVRHGGDFGEGIDLPVGMLDAGANLRAAVFEKEHVGHIEAGSERLRTLRPQCDHAVNLRFIKRAKARSMVGRKKDDLAAILRERRPTVHKPAHLVGLLGLQPPGAKGTFAGRLIRPILSTTHHHDQFAGHWISAPVGLSAVGHQ